MRYEIKIPFHINYKTNIKNYLIDIKSLERQFSNRTVNSIYFDTKDFQFARHNIEGISKRFKFRTRWYNNDSKNFKYEIKRKINKLGSKSTYINNSNQLPIENLFCSKNNYLCNQLKNDEKYFINILNLIPVIKISYLREYFIYKNKVRITIDHTPSYESISHSNILRQYDKFSVLEFKFEEENYHYAKNLIKKSLINPKRYSKYIKGLSLMNKIVYF